MLKIGSVFRIINDCRAGIVPYRALTHIFLGCSQAQTKNADMGDKTSRSNRYFHNRREDARQRECDMDHWESGRRLLQTVASIHYARRGTGC